MTSSALIFSKVKVWTTKYLKKCCSFNQINNVSSNSFQNMLSDLADGTIKSQKWDTGSECVKHCEDMQLVSLVGGHGMCRGNHKHCTFLPYMVGELLIFPRQPVCHVHDVNQVNSYNEVRARTKACARARLHLATSWLRQTSIIIDVVGR
jgi:hypothetical protein